MAIVGTNIGFARSMVAARSFPVAAGQETVPQPALDVERHQDVGPEPEELGHVAIAQGGVERLGVVHRRHDDRRLQLGHVLRVRPVADARHRPQIPGQRPLLVRRGDHL